MAQTSVRKVWGRVSMAWNGKARLWISLKDSVSMRGRYIFVGEGK